MEKLVHVKIGTTNEVLPVIALYTDGCFKDIYELKTSKGRCWVHKRWCSPVVPQKDDTDWRGFLKAHWDNEHGYCRVDCLEEFMEIFNRAASNISKNDNEQGKRITQEVRKHRSDHNSKHNNKRRAPVELSLFPDF